jgi:phenylpropionate dioxygenase-like ring-hydroxylating dioxygenase large terminal subunit
MLSREDNELMCRVGRDTPMGQAMRHFWMPALLSSELAGPGGDPVHVELLNENLVAFRDSEGKVGLLDEMCCHRGASLTVGHVESCGIRCIYHGWLFAADGTVLETPNVPDSRFKARFKAKAYPVREAGGVVWTYLGDPDKMPAFPDFPALTAPRELVLAAFGIFGCNYVQVLEGLLDSSHLSLLHQSQLRSTNLPDIAFVRKTSHMKFDVAPRIEVEETEFGLHYGAIRQVDGHAETNVTGFISPFFILNPNDMILVTVPLTDEKTGFYLIAYDGENRYGEEPLASQHLKATGFDQASVEAFGMTRKTFDTMARPQRANSFRQDRAAMRAGHFTGLPSLTPEDLVVAVSGGGIRDRCQEHLSTADAAIARMYRVLLKSARQVREGGKPVAYGQSVAHLRGRRVTLPQDADWRSLVPDHKPLRSQVA